MLDSWIHSQTVRSRVSYLVDVFDGRMWKRHIDHIKDNPRSVLPELTDQSPKIVGFNFDPIPVASTNSDPVVNVAPFIPSLDVAPSPSSHEADVGISVSTSPTHVEHSTPSIITEPSIPSTSANSTCHYPSQEH